MGQLWKFHKFVSLNKRMTESSHLQAKGTRKCCRKREGGAEEEKEEAPLESQNLPLKYGYVAILGRRRVMEEPMTVMPPEKLPGPGGYSFFAAYGGSGRPKVAEMCTDKLHECLGKLSEEEGVGLGKVVKDCFSCMYDKYWSGQDRETFTAVVVVAGDNGEAVVVNCGGSKAVLWTGGLALPLWTDHNKPHEVHEAGGGTGNVGVVSTSKSQGEGDECVKGKRRWEPEVRVMRRDEKSEDSFVIIANDGLWKVVRKEMACEVVRKCVGGEMKIRLPSEGGAASQAAAILAELAIAKGSEDNITIIVVHLNSST